MRTIRLFDDNAFIKEFEAQVLSCEQQGKRYAAVLDKTAFFPEEGGQPADSGVLGGEAVLDVQEKDGVIYHYLNHAISGTVHGSIDWNKRFVRMQNHSGEHLLSGLIHRHTGADNISFSLTDEQTTLAFNVPLSEALLNTVELEANEAVFQNVAIEAFYPPAEQLKTLTYRSKLELTEQVRLVRIEGYDLCACCAPHCERTGQIGLIKIVGSEAYKGGTKVYIHCGFQALAHYGMLLDESKNISHLLCAKLERLDTAVEKLKKDKEALEYNFVGLKRKRIEEAIAAVEATRGNYLALTSFSGDDLRLFADGLKEKVGGVIVALEGNDASAYRYVITSEHVEVADMVKTANAVLNGKGGGRDNMARGSFGCTFAEIEAFFDN